MKKLNIFKSFLLLALLGTAGSLSAQIVVHPNAYGNVPTGFPTNWYKDMANVRVDVNSPSGIAGEKAAAAAIVGASDWPDIRDTFLYNLPIVMDLTSDSNLCSVTSVDMTGKIAVVWRGDCYFTQKALNAQHAGALACIIINELPGAAPFSPGYVASGGAVTIPVIMIGNLDGIAIANQYRHGAVNMTISPWGYSYGADLGIIPHGAARWHNNAIPYNQVISSGNPLPYQGADGAWVANFGEHDITHAKLSTSVTFTPTGGSSTTIHTDNISVDTFKVSDSILAMYPVAYNLTGITGKGQVTVKYALSSDSTDLYPSNDTASESFYLTDSLYAKGSYDFVNNRPISQNYEGPASLAAGNSFYIWGNMFYINKTGSAASQVQWGMSASSDTTGPFTGIPTMNVYVFQWVEGMNGEPVDSLVENGELQLVGLGIKDFTHHLAPDTSGGFFNVSILDSNGLNNQPLLNASSWYYVAAEIPTGYFMGCDGVRNTFPRSYGRWENNIIEYASPLWAANRYSDANAQVNEFGQAMAPCAFGGNFRDDSVIYSTQIGLIPSVSMIVNNTPITDTTTHGGGAGVKNVSSFAKFYVYPNPTADNINVAIGLDNSSNVTYTIIDGHAREITKVTHNNVTAEVFTYNTNGLASGNYYMIVNAGGKQAFRKFTVIKQ